MSLKKYLHQFTKEQLIEQIIELQKKYKDVKTYYDFTQNPDASAQLIVVKVKKAIQKLLNPPIPKSPNLRDARKEVSGLKKLSPPDDSIADVMLHYAECGVVYTNMYGDMDGPFYNSIAGMFGDACEFIGKNELKELFKLRCKKVVDDSKGIGWGFYDDLAKAYDSVFGV